MSAHDDPRFQQAVDLFNRRAWYEAHDAFEEIWHETAGADRRLLQGILQIAVAHVHLERGNLRGATILLGEGVGRLSSAISGESTMTWLLLSTSLLEDCGSAPHSA